jgi:cell division protein FtsI (penicillin-binding protein 3)
MVPASSPKIVAVVTINDPKGEKYYGGEIAAPVFSRVMQAALRLMDITPDRLHELGEQNSEHAGVLDAPVNAEIDSVREQHGSV